MTYTTEETQQFCDEGMGNEYEARCLDEQGTWDSGDNDAPTTVTTAPEPEEGVPGGQPGRGAQVTPDDPTYTGTTTPVTTTPTLPVTGPPELLMLALIAAALLSAGGRMVRRSEKA